MSIQKSVGQNAPNIYNDVIIIQKLLNKARLSFPRFGSDIKALAEDGVCGGMTIGAIKSFQSIVMQYRTIDGVIEPNRNTWKKLNGNVGNKNTIAKTASFQKPSIDNFISWFTGQSNGNLATIYNEYRTSIDKKLGIKSPASSPIEAKKISTFSQADAKWATSTLGNGSGGRATFRASGCALVSLTMAATYLGSNTNHWPKGLKPSELNPLKVNDIFKKAGVFGKAAFTITLTSGASALGMKAVDTGRSTQLDSSHLQKVDDCLRNGGLVMANVDYRGDKAGDHWVLITEKMATGEYHALDPAYGKEITFTKTPPTGTATKSVILYGKAQTNAKNAGNYKVVRILTLKAS